MPFQMAGPLGTYPHPSPVSRLTVGRGHEQSCQGNRPNTLFPLPAEIFQERKDSCAGGAGVRPHSIRTTEGPAPRGQPCSSACHLHPSCCFTGSFKDKHLGFSQPSDPGRRGCACCELVGQECHFFQEGLSAVSSFSHGFP